VKNGFNTVFQQFIAAVHRTVVVRSAVAGSDSSRV